MEIILMVGSPQVLERDSESRNMTPADQFVNGKNGRGFSGMGYAVMSRVYL
jgi:hypothetical protein